MNDSGPYLIDTDVLIYFLNDVHGASGLVRGLMTRRASISAITLMELLDGLGNSRDPRAEILRMHEVMRFTPVLGFSASEAYIAAGLRQALRSQGRNFRPRSLDIQIAATAIANDLTLVTNNVGDYRGLPDLRVEGADLAV